MNRTPLPVRPSNDGDHTAAYSDIGESTAEQAPPIGGWPRCRVHYEGYHDCSHDCFFREFGISEEEYSEWAEKSRVQVNAGDDECPWSAEYTIRSFLRHFNVPRDRFEEVCRKYGLAELYSPEVIYGDDPAAADAFYRDIDQRARDTHRNYRFRQLCLAIAREYAHDDELIPYLNFYAAGDKAVGILDLVREYNVPRSFFDGYFADQKRIHENEVIRARMEGTPEPYDTEFDYDFDVLYNGDGSAKEYDGLSAYEIDAMFCGVEDFFLGY